MQRGLACRRTEPDLLGELAQHRHLGRLAVAHAALGELPAAATGPAAEKQAPVVAHQHDAHVRPETFSVDPISHRHPSTDGPVYNGRAAP